jgi:predicted PurR-regulated permease PerM
MNAALASMAARPETSVIPAPRRIARPVEPPAKAKKKAATALDRRNIGLGNFEPERALPPTTLAVGLVMAYPYCRIRGVQGIRIWRTEVVMSNATESAVDQRLVASAMVSASRIGALLLLLYLCLDIVAPFLHLLTWASIIAVALHPAHVSLSRRLGRREKPSAALLALTGIAILIVPVWLLGESTISGIQAAAESLRQGSASIPAPSPEVAEWPIVGERLHGIWSQAATNLEATLVPFGPQLKALGQRAVGFAAGAALTILEFIAAFAIAGVLLTTAEVSHRLAQAILGRLLGVERGRALTDLSTQTIRSVAKGVLGIAFLQALMASIGLVVMDVPAAGLWAGAVLALAIVQLPPILVLGPIALWVFSVAEPVPATIFLVYSVLVSFSDAFLKPLLLGRGVEVPMLVILLGAIGGVISSGVIGLFVGAVVLALGYEILIAGLLVPEAAPTPPPSDAKD